MLNSWNANPGQITIPNSNRIILANYYQWIEDQIGTFINLDKNWDGYGAIPLILEIGDKAKKFIICLNGDIIEKIFDIFPNPHGTITIEWENNRNEKLSLEIGVPNYSYFVRYNDKEPKFGKGEDILEDSKDLTKTLSDLFKYELPRYIL